MRSARSISMAASFPPSRERVAAKSSSISRTSATQASRSSDDRSAELREACVALVREILEDFAATRSREGGKLAAMLIERAERMKSLLASIQPKLPEAIDRKSVV